MKIALFIAIIVLSLSHLSHGQVGFCPELDVIGCSCLESDVKLKCEDFEEFSDLDFSLLEDDSPLRERMEELELMPKDKKNLDNNLKLESLRMIKDGHVILRNIDNFDFESSPFEDLTEAENVSLTITDSILTTTLSPCASATNFDPDTGLFSKFTTLYLGENVEYSDTFCPLIFYKAKIDTIEATSMNNGNFLQFSLIDDDEDTVFDLDVNVVDFKIKESTELVINNLMLSKFVFGGLRHLTLSGVDLKEIDDRAFEHTNKLIKLDLEINNMEEFVQSSNHEWML